MKLEERRLIDEALVAEEPCLGAAFCSYTFDPAYFEEHVLRSLLHLRGDPEEDAARYHEEARVALQETPVACIVDASVRHGGRRLPYDLLLVRSRVFHPKVMLALYASGARLAIGSGNATKSGLEQNTELFFVRALRYDDPGHAALLRDVDAFLARCAGLANNAGTQLAFVREQLAARIQNTPPPREQDAPDVRFVSTFGGRLIDQLGASLPTDGRIVRVGVLAPFFEQDDLDAASETEGLASVLGELLALRPSPDAVLDLGVPWDDAPLAPPPATARPTLDEHLGVLWAHRIRQRTRDGAVDQLVHFVPERAMARRIEATDDAGNRCHLERAALEESIAADRLWPVPRPTVFAPATILARLAAERTVQLWLHPSADLSVTGRARRRPLHAKAFLITATRRGQTMTYALIGSANASRAALGRSVEQGGNVEAGVLCRFDGEVTLRELLPALVAYAREKVDLQDRTYTAAPPDLSAWIADVVHDAAARTLTVTWQENGPGALGAWVLRYLDRDLTRGEGRPAEPTVVLDFDLAAASAEVVFGSGGGEWTVPIRVADLSALPSCPELAALGLRELLALLGRRMGAERLAALRAQRGALGVTTVLDVIFGEGFGATDVFKAWWGAADDLTTAPTMPSFRHRLLGATGVCTAWARLVEAAQRAADEQTRDEVWVYGSELLRELGRVKPADGPDVAAKRALLVESCARVRSDLMALAPNAGARPWFAAVASFYALEATRGTP